MARSPGDDGGKKADVQAEPCFGNRVIEIARVPLVEEVEQIEHHQRSQHAETQHEERMHFREIEQRFCNGARREMAHLPDVHQPADGDENRLQAQDHHPHNPDQAQLADPLQVESQAKPVLFHHTHSFPEAGALFPGIGRSWDRTAYASRTS